MTKELFLIPTPTVRLPQSNYNAINHDRTKKFFKCNTRIYKHEGKYYYSWLDRKFMGDLYILWLYSYGYVQVQDQGQTLTQPEWFGPNNLNSPISLGPPATMAFWEEEPHQPSCFVHHCVPRAVPGASYCSEIWWMNGLNYTAHRTITKMRF